MASGRFCNLFPRLVNLSQQPQLSFRKPLHVYGTRAIFRYFSSDQNALASIRNFGISAHVDSGKTTLTERILFYTGRIDAIHEIQGSDGVGAKMDSMELERERGITIQSAATFTNWKYGGQAYHFNIVDTPGHVDFQMEVERSLRVLDGAIFVICGVHGVQSQTMAIDRQMQRYKVARVIFINKLDRATANSVEAVEMIRAKLGLYTAPLQMAIGTGRDFKGIIDLVRRCAYEYHGAHGESRVEIPIPPSLKLDVQKARSHLIEMLAEVDDELAEKYLTNDIDSIPASCIRAAIRRSTLSRKFVPILMGSAKGNKGVQDVLDAVCEYLPSAADVVTEGLPLKSDAAAKPVLVYPDPKLKTIAMAFKIQELQPYGCLTYTKVYQGTLHKGKSLLDVRTGKKVQWKKMYRLHSDEAKEVAQARAGDIVALSGLDVSSGTTLTEEPADITLLDMHVPAPVISVSATVEKGSDPSKFTKALQRFQREDPTFTVSVHPESKEYILSGMGELHLDIYKERMKREYGVQIATGTPKVNLREVITKRVNFEYTHKRQTGGRGEWAKICGYFEPIDASRNTLPPPEFESRLLGASIPPQFITSVRKGFYETVACGPLSSSPIVNIRFVLEDGATHEVDSSDIAFRNCVKQCFAQYYNEGMPAVLEPLMRVEIVCPTEYAVDLQCALTRKQMTILDSLSNDTATTRTITAEAPLRIMFGFVNLLRQQAQGQGEFSMRFERYIPVV